jgi:hypothetical protein
VGHEAPNTALECEAERERAREGAGHDDIAPGQASVTVRERIEDDDAVGTRGGGDAHAAYYRRSSSPSLA